LRKILPVAISLALVGYLLWSVSPRDLRDKAQALDWRLLVPVTAAFVAALYFWEALCFRSLFSLADRPLTYQQMLRVRGISYLAGIFNYEAGQAIAAWRVAVLQQTGLLSALSRTVLLAYHDLLVLMALGAMGATLSNDPSMATVRWFCLSGLGILIIVGLVPLMLPEDWRARLRQTRWGAWLGSWSVFRSAQLVLLRIVYFALFVIYAALALAICRIPVDHTVTLGTVPLVLLADALPSASGLGTRDTALQWLLNPQWPEQTDGVLLAMSLIWSMGLLLGRLTIGLINLWWPGAAAGSADQPPIQETPISQTPGAESS
jgi:hypothetical protein